MQFLKPFPTLLIGMLLGAFIVPRVLTVIKR